MPSIETVNQVDPIALLRSLAEIDYDIIQAYETAIDKLEDPTFKKGMSAFLEEHRAHLARLDVLIADLGGAPSATDDYRHVLETGKVFLSSVVGDHAIVSAMQSNEEEAADLYTQATLIRGLPAVVSKVLDANLIHERKHRAWMEQAMYVLKG